VNPSASCPSGYTYIFLTDANQPIVWQGDQVWENKQEKEYHLMNYFLSHPLAPPTDSAIVVQHNCIHVNLLWLEFERGF
jgi:hypothetical protein